MSSEFDRRLDDWFDAVEPRHIPSDILPRALVEARATGQMRAPWHRFAATLESAWTARTSLAPGLAMAAIALILAVALAGAAVGAGLVSLPPAPPPVVDGLIAVQDRFEAVPDGQLPAYVVRFIDPRTGEEVFRTPADVRACAAHFSPDGSQYAFLQYADAGEVDVAVAPVAPDYQPTLLLHKPWQTFFDPSWAPDGSALVMTVEAGSQDASYRELWVVPVDGTPARRVTDAHTSLSADWSSSGDWIAFHGTGSEGQAPPLYVVRPDGSDLQLLRPSGAGNPAWSPLRDELAYIATDGRLHVVGVDGQERLATADLRDPTLPDQSAGMPVWSPDATKIALVVPNGALEVFDVAASSVSETTTAMPVSRQDWALDGRPVWSADGRSLIAVTGDGNLWEVALDGSQQRLIADHVQDRCMSASYALSWQQLAS
jgi:Tol biopolymer transport system component